MLAINPPGVAPQTPPALPIIPVYVFAMSAALDRANSEAHRIAPPTARRDEASCTHRGQARMASPGECVKPAHRFGLPAGPGRTEGRLYATGAERLRQGRAALERSSAGTGHVRLRE